MLALALSLMAGCGWGHDESSLDGLGEGVLAALVAGDTAALERFRLTEQEHNDEVWPELPASAPEVNFPVDYAWTNIENRNRRGLARLLPIFEGEDVSFRAVECRGETQAFESFVVETDCSLVFTRPDGQLWEVQAFKDVLVREGERRIFRYYDEEPRLRAEQSS